MPTINQLPFNINVQLDSINLQTVKTDEIKGKIQEIYGTGTEIIVSQFPDIVVFLVATAQINIVLHKNKVVITDTKVGDIAVRDISKFITLAITLLEILRSQGSTITSYGFNFIYELIAEDIPNTGNYIKSKFLKGTAIRNRIGYDIETTSLHLVFRNGDNARYLIHLDPGLTPADEGTNRVNISVNVHFNDGTIGTLTQLQERFLDKNVKSREIINKIFSLT